MDAKRVGSPRHGTVSSTTAAALVAALLTAVGTPPAAVAQAAGPTLDDLQSFAVDMHLHTDHSSDAGLPHQEFDTPESHDTFLDEQRDQAIRLQMDGVAFTDHRTFDQHFDPDFRVTDDTVLMTGEEWGSARHGTAFGLVEVLQHDPSLEECGLAAMSMEAAAQGGLLGVAHPKDFYDGSCSLSFEGGANWPVSHVEAVRGGDGIVQEAQLADSNGSNTAWYLASLQAGMRIPAVNGSDNHFKQVWGAGPAGPGGSSTHALVTTPTEVGFIDAVLAGRTSGGWTSVNARLTTLLDVDLDGSWDAIMGGWAAPTGDTVRVGVRVTTGSGTWVQIIDDTGTIVSEQPVAAPDQTVTVDVPAASDFWFATVTTQELLRPGLPDPLDYIDTHQGVATPVWTSAPPATTAADPTSPTARALSRLSGTDTSWSGFPDLATDGADVVAVWQQRRDSINEVVVARSLDTGRTWSAPVVLSTSDDARLPKASRSGDRVTVVWEDHDPSGLGGALVEATSADGGVTFTAPAVLAAGPTWRAELASTVDADHLVWLEAVDGEVWSVQHAVRRDGVWSTQEQLSTAEATDGPRTQYATPPRTIRWVPYAGQPDVAVNGDTVVVSWQDNRDDPTPGRSGTPDDVEVWAAVSTDGGVTFSADARVTERLLRVDNGEPEGVEGFPARNVDTAVLGDGTIALAYQRDNASVHDDIWVQISRDAGTTWSSATPVAPPDARFRYQPTIIVRDGPASFDVVWQDATDPTWQLVSASTIDGGATFTAPVELTATTRYAGWPEADGDVITFVGETAEGFHAHVLSGNSGPTARFSFTPTAPRPGQVVTFDASASFDDAPGLTSAWDLDDDGAFDDETALTFTRTFDADGTFPIALRVTDADTLISEVTRDVVVSSVNTAPIARIVGPVTSGQYDAVTFDGTTSTDPEGDALTHVWDFGDGSGTSTEASPSHDYDIAGIFVVSLTVDDGNGGTDETTRIVDVAPNLAPVVDAGDDRTVDVDTAVSLTAEVADREGDVVSVVWDFGDDSESATGTSAVHTWSEVGDFTVTVIATDEHGASATDTFVVSVEDQPADVESIRRVAGEDRIATAIALSQDAFTTATTALIARHDLFPDALAGNTLAVEAGGPILLSRPSALPDDVRAELDRLGVTKVYLLGGEAALSPAVATSLADLDVVRLAGATRFETAAAIADEIVELGGTVARVVVALGAHAPRDAWPDALSAATFGARGRAPVLLVRSDTVPASTRSAALRILGADGEIIIVGGESVVSAGVAEALAKEHSVRRIAGEDRYATSVALAEEAQTFSAGRAPVFLASGGAFPDALSAGPAAAAAGGVLVLVHPDHLDLSVATRDWIAQHREEIDEVAVAGGIVAIARAVMDAVEALMQDGG